MGPTTPTLDGIGTKHATAVHQPGRRRVEAIVRAGTLRAQWHVGGRNPCHAHQRPAGVEFDACTPTEGPPRASGSAGAPAALTPAAPAPARLLIAARHRRRGRQPARPAGQVAAGARPAAPPPAPTPGLTLTARDERVGLAK